MRAAGVTWCLAVVVCATVAVGPAVAGEVGANDFRISYMAGSGNPNFDATSPAVAYNSVNDQYLVVWVADDNEGGLVDGEYEIFGQLLDGQGAPIGSMFRISDMGGTGLTAYGAFAPDVAYNSVDNEYLVVWYGDDNVAPLVDNEYEIFGQLLDANGVEIGSNDFRISDMGPNGNTAYVAYDPAVAYNSANNEYLVVWYGDDNVGGLVAGEAEIFGQLLDANGVEIGSNDFRVSDAGGTGSTISAAQSPGVAYNSVDNQYLVVWSADDTDAGLVDEEYEIFGQRLGADGTEIGQNDFRISDMGGTGDPNYDAKYPAIAYNSVDNQYLVVWYGNDNVGGLVEGEIEAFGQLLDHTGAEIGANDFRISEMGGTGNPAWNVTSLVKVAHNRLTDQYLVCWSGDDNRGGMVDNEREVFCQVLTARGGGGTQPDERISDAGGSGNTDYLTYEVAVAANSSSGEYLAVWSGGDNVDGMAISELEIFGQRYLSDLIFADGFGTGDSWAWSGVTP